MHFSTIVTVIAATMGMTANAAPALQARQNCPANQHAKCCNALVPTLLGGIIVSVGLGCIDLIAGSCAAQTACCSQQNNNGVVVNVCDVL
ncbi:hypothetical protein W97_02753 [Coniosporium apollinis CBS 100218]|uniref:Hydrophobin n=1 Tax=Coniosporium apollinis (strain CBS 100218) TaxID=1168221 RepID=R7YNN0_CONA1|nr:uncharacterized protein W97_02753 [Coniosporium apollinis CBS 100218]EON63525.1 hypothetical protein W97_02753 [Coniosporium apollinis CBS 100218]